MVVAYFHVPGEADSMAPHENQDLAGRACRGLGEAGGREPLILVMTPGRVNLIGEHTDYNGGWALPFAIDRHIALAAAPSEGRTRLFALDRGERVEFDPDGLPAPRRGHWSDYLVGMLAEFRAAALPIPAVDIAFAGDIPAGGGLSSSAALSTGAGLALDRLAGSVLPREAIASMAQSTEHRYAGVRCGIMDQYAVLLCREGSGILLDCRTRAWRHVPIAPAGHRFLLCNSMVKHELASSGYNDRRRECEEALEILRRNHPGLEDLRACTPESLEKSRAALGGIRYRRVRHQVGENARVLAAETALAKGDMAALGALLSESHASLSADFEVSSPEQDFLVATALSCAGVRGARMTGGGFGGNVIVLVAEAEAEEAAAGIREAYGRAFGVVPEILDCAPSGGARIRDPKGKAVA
jgi:galactokinase